MARAAGVGHTITIGIELVTEDCYSCGVLFALSADLRTKRLADKQTFYCPNGHGQVYSGESDAAKARRLAKELERARENAAWQAEYAREEAARRGAAERSLAATRGQVTKLRKRVVAGACPFGCRRHFANLERHVATRHDGQSLEGESA
jgi:hypothetical protein